MKTAKYLSAMLLLASMWACKKDKNNFVYIEQTVPPLNSSTVRLMNYGRPATELIINDTPLTSLVQPSIEGLYLEGNTKPTIYFSNGRLGKTYSIPQRFIRADGTANVKIGAMAYGMTGIQFSKAFQVKENVNVPTDYYNVLYGDHKSSDVIGSDSLFAIPRSISPPADPKNFRIRLLNLSSAPDKVGLEGNLTLVYADGTPVNNTTSHIASGNYSDYTELPYGTYQFKVVTEDGKVLPAVPVNPDEQLKTVNGTTGTMTVGFNPPTDLWFTYAPTQTYQPGGVYTVMVCASGAFDYYPAGSNTTSQTTLNAFRIIPDNKESLNITWGRVQAVNAYPGSNIRVTVDNQPVQEDALTFGNSSPYKIFIAGNHTIQVTDGNGKSLGSTSVNITGSDNYSIWCYPDANGQPVVKTVVNNLSGAFYYNPNKTGDDGATNQFKVTMPLWIRFLNLSTDIPEVTFTGADGQLLISYLTYTGAASQRLQQGQVITEQPYVMFQPLLGINKLQAYASRPNMLPGDWIRGIPSLKGTDFIARPDLYKTVNLPPYETGVYTVALVGSLNPKKAGDVPAKMIIIKHNK
ncbi:DUF4397 domain-containing protein [Chitinophaga dinghuensis]|nr:DUF4397 domain-containing protein [Chitinophaga dinghuensis]